MSKRKESHEIVLPAIVDDRAAALSQLTSALGVPRDILASDREIAHAWGELPRLLTQIPHELLSEHHVRMCVAVSAGLFDAGVNYAWNSAIVELRKKVYRFGFNVVEQLTGKDFDEDNLNDLQDSDLLDLCLKLNLISEDAFFFLDQCRDVRNNFSTAHPPMGQIDDDEFIVFLKRCAKYALSDTANPTGVDTVALIRGIKRSRFSDEQNAEWCQRIDETHDAQRDLIFSTLHGIYCDPDSPEESRLNAMDICRECSSHFSSTTRSQLLNRHSDYVAEGETDRQVASMNFFEELGLLSLLNEVERHTVISSACARLLTVHLAFNNFYNEPPFAERLREISEQTAIPRSCQLEFVTVVVMCAVGNQYGICNAAYIDYSTMISSFSRHEISIMLKLPRTKTTIGQRIHYHSRCRRKFKEILEQCIDPASVPTNSQAVYEEWLGGK